MQTSTIASLQPNEDRGAILSGVFFSHRHSFLSHIDSESSAEADQPLIEDDAQKRPIFIHCLFSLIHILLTILFISVNIYALSTVNSSPTALSVCGKDLWNLLLVHIIMPILMGFLFCILALVLSPFMLQCTHRHPVYLFLIPLLTMAVYNSTMLCLGIKYIIDVQNKKGEDCVQALTEASKGLSPNFPLLIVLSWVFVAIDSLSLLLQLCAFTLISFVGVSALSSSTGSTQ